MRHLNQSPFILPLVLISLVGCGKTLDTANIEATIKDGITKQGGSSIKSVICPDNIKPEAGKEFECVGVLDSGAGFPISVKQQDAQGNIFWEATSVKGLLNMAQLQTEFEQGLTKEIGQASIDCGKSTIYRSVKPGETFECQLIKRDSKSANEPEASEKPASTDSAKPAPKPNDTIQVTIQPSGDINWQRIINVTDVKTPTPTTTAATTVTDTKKPTGAEAPKSEAPDSNPSPAPPAAKSPEDFLNQPGAANDFE
ncbi:putative lipoprotein [Leptolyngbya sp. NIES-3755]|nr:putative lipoprotein [Leptolyngbya sp. NIES-3755]